MSSVTVFQRRLFCALTHTNLIPYPYRCRICCMDCAPFTMPDGFVSVTERQQPSEDDLHYLRDHGPQGLIARPGVELSHDLLDLLCGMLQFRPEARLSLEAILAHPWLGPR